MKTIVAGSRTITDVNIVAFAIEQSGFLITEIASGMARGVDMAAVEYAHRTGVPLRPFPADWETEGRAAGYNRNVRMAEWAEALVAIWDGKSRGTKHMIDIARKAGLKVFVYRVTVETVLDRRIVELMEGFNCG
jgi:hypothetical protein